VGQESFNIPFSEIFGVFEIVIEDVAFDPGSIGLIRVVGVVLAAEVSTDAVKQFYITHNPPIGEC